ncbi:P-loop containing nucleoside triphosphate hydrolases superfamily protein [Tasmannia lanceolata]|uniref:P-loop containing nucleoside triphosphate hydrolases superfamily protein n=1 Tax=Tasmannia lanceolata TaxID=3420 RepID=UPI0040637201
MPTFSETASSCRNRFRIQETSDSDPVRASPGLFRSASKDHIFQSSTITSNGDGEREDLESCRGSSIQSFEIHEDPSFWKDHNVQVIIRIRPLSSSEVSLQGYNKCVSQDSCQTITWTGHPESRFTFDVVADENVSQEKLFKVAGLPMVENCMGGYNSCMFAYGQTGSGKTHTMLGDIEGGTRRHSVNCGMTPRVFECLFSRIQKEKESRKDEKLRFTCKCSFLEIYNEQILDLLDPSSMNLQIREDAKKGVYVENLREYEVSCARDVIQQLVQGAANRKVATTNMNIASSRSHSVFTCVIESKWESQGVTHHRFARLNLVDLAGSERQKSSGAEGERLKEATNINKSLSTLGLVIMNLVNISNGKSQHVPYRDSKLTFLLQDSLGGNSKTTIIANISPSNCCALETLSTLKFAQRAKFIRNNAIVNEDASGDVLAMRIQIHQLKKEVNRLQGLLNGGAENQETDNWSLGFPGSPGSFKWDGVQGSFSPLTSGKRISQKKEYEAALIGAFRREQDKEIALKALTAENEAAMQLTKQRDEEIQSLKLRLRFREAGIKRLEAVASGKISAEAHLLQEKGELLKEIDVLRNQVDRNQEVTRFAMENLRLKEELRRFQSFYEGGEREMMNEQIEILQNKLLEALDWKLMHEKDPAVVQSGSSDLGTLADRDDNLLISNQDLSQPWGSSTNEENEFLHIEAIQNQREVEALRRNLTVCLETKEKLERRVDELVSQLEEERASIISLKNASVSSRINGPDHDGSHDQMELKTMVDAIAAASQREAEAHETAIILVKENEELRKKLKVLIEDNNKLIELYEAASAGGNSRAVHEENEAIVGLSNQESCHLETNDVEHLECERQVNELQEENEKLMGLYEKAMQERDEYKRMLCSYQKSDVGVKEFNCPEKLVEVDEERIHQIEGAENLKVVEVPAESEEAKSSTELNLSRSSELDYVRMGVLEISGRCTENPVAEDMEIQIEEQGNAVANSENCDIEIKSAIFAEVREEELNMARMKLEQAQDKLANAAKAISFFGMLEKANVEVDKFSTEIEAAENGIQIKQKEIASLKLKSSEIHERKAATDNKLLALKSTLMSFSSSVNYWEQREARARTKVDASRQFMEQTKEELTHIQVCKDEIETAQMKAQQSEISLRNDIDCLKSKLQDAENQRKSEKVLFAIDNVDQTDVTAQRNWHFGKAGELLKSEEERTKMANEIKQSKEKLKSVQKEIEDLKQKSKALDVKIQSVSGEATKGLKSVEEAVFALQNVIQERATLSEMIQEGRGEIEKMIFEYHNCVFVSDLKEEEIILCEEELCVAMRSLEELRGAKMEATQKKNQVLEDNRWIFKLCDSDEYYDSWRVSEKVEEGIGNIQRSVLEAKSLLVL